MIQENPKIIKKYRLWLFFCLIIGIGIGYYGQTIYPRKTLSGQQTQIINEPIRLANHNYSFINPLLFCDVSENKEFNEFQPLDLSIQRIINARKQSKDANEVSVYFRDLNPGKWVGIGENDRYSPASMLKVATMIAVYKEAESNPDILKLKVTFKGGNDENAPEHFRPSKVIKPGSTYTMNELVQYMIQYSDNNAANLIHQVMDTASLLGVYTDLGLTLPNKSNNADFMSPKIYSHILRTLFSASYLNRTMSEQALQLLANVDFDKGIRAGVPNTVTIAHKFGERIITNPDGQTALFNELHECGIIYYPNRPYMLCIMTKGKNFDALAEVIKDISSGVYEYVKQSDSQK